MFYDSAVKRYKQQMREELFWLEFNASTVKEANDSKMFPKGLDKL